MVKINTIDSIIRQELDVLLNRSNSNIEFVRSILQDENTDVNSRKKKFYLIINIYEFSRKNPNFQRELIDLLFWFLENTKSRSYFILQQAAYSLVLFEEESIIARLRLGARKFKNCNVRIACLLALHRTFPKPISDELTLWYNHIATHDKSEKVREHANYLLQRDNP